MYLVIKGALRRALFFSLFFSGASWAAEPFLQLQGMGYSGPQPLYEYSRDWQAPLETKTNAFINLRLLSGAHYGNRSVALGYRSANIVLAHEDTVALYHADKNDTPLTIGRQYQLDLEVNSVDLWELYGAQRFSWRDGATRLQLGASLLFADRSLKGEFNGLAVAVAANDYDFNFTVDYRYTRDPLFDRPMPSNIYGYGVSFDVDFQHQLSPGSDLYLQVNNLLSALYWDDLGQTTGTANSDTKRFDSNGYVQFDPAFRGRESTKSYVQRLPWQYRLAYQRQLNERYALELALVENEAEALPSVMFEQATGKGRLGYIWYPKQVALGLQYQSERLQLRYAADAIKPKEAHLLDFRIAYVWSF